MLLHNLSFFAGNVNPELVHEVIQSLDILLGKALREDEMAMVTIVRCPSCACTCARDRSYD